MVSKVEIGRLLGRTLGIEAICCHRYILIHLLAF
jgi:DNA-directed RNA polymerase subunit N (RpoN/RPB10)